ncbi:MAG: hypothetical protein O6837_07960 [Deltaproteobacteria bacterium]|nr:hypothetical protein [Deltaproteobacteria bacterium]
MKKLRRLSASCQAPSKGEGSQIRRGEEEVNTLCGERSPHRDYEGQKAISGSAKGSHCDKSRTYLRSQLVGQDENYDEGNQGQCAYYFHNCSL